MSKPRRLKIAKEPIKTEKTAAKQKNRRIAKFLLWPFGFLKIFRFLVPSYFKNSYKELKQVTWPSRRETLKLTFAVFMFAIVFGAFITAVDYGLNQVFKRILLK